MELSTYIINYATCADEGGTQGAIFMCYIIMEPKLYNPVSWDLCRMKGILYVIVIIVEWQLIL